MSSAKSADNGLIPFTLEEPPEIDGLLAVLRGRIPAEGIRGAVAGFAGRIGLTLHKKVSQNIMPQIIIMISGS